MAGNLAAALPRRRRRGDPMADFDRLPAPLRRWLAGAALPWSPRSAARAYGRAQREGDAPGTALARLDALEARLVAADAARVWGAGHPASRAGGAVRIRRR